MGSQRGREALLDLVAGIAVVALGHGHRRRSPPPADCSPSTRCRPASAAPGALFAWEHAGVKPDTATTKGLANGLPIGALLVSDEAPTGLRAGRPRAVGGNPVACAGGRARSSTRWTTSCSRTLRAISDQFKSSLDGTRGLGLLLAVELGKPAAGLVPGGSTAASSCAAGESSRRITPPLTAGRRGRSGDRRREVSGDPDEVRRSSDPLRLVQQRELARRRARSPRRSATWASTQCRRRCGARHRAARARGGWATRSGRLVYALPARATSTAWTSSLPALGGRDGARGQLLRDADGRAGSRRRSRSAIDSAPAPRRGRDDRRREARSCPSPPATAARRRPRRTVPGGCVEHPPRGRTARSATPGR